MSSRDQWLTVLVVSLWIVGLSCLGYGADLTWIQRCGVFLVMLASSGLTALRIRERRVRREREAREPR